jgi:hypothetical protein
VARLHCSDAKASFCALPTHLTPRNAEDITATSEKWLAAFSTDITDVTQERDEAIGQLDDHFIAAASGGLDARACDVHPSPAKGNRVL